MKAERASRNSNPEAFFEECRRRRVWLIAELTKAFGEKHPVVIRASNRELFMGFTPGEVKLQDLMARGLSDKQIGAALSLSINTVRNFKKQIKAKWGINSSQAIAILWAQASPDGLANLMATIG